jgi:REP element-mobilizing transposase RayT
LARPALSRHHPVHVTLRVVGGLPSLREGALFFGVRAALKGARDRFGFRLVHFSVQGDHLHLLAEASDRRALSRGIQGLAVRVARAVNRRVGRRGRVFGDRYHARSLRTPRAVRTALVYVLMNARKHGRGLRRLPAGFGDFCSSARWFTGWGRPRELVFGLGRGATALADAPVVAPRTWLLRTGASRAGPIDPDDAPLGARFDR